MESFDWFLVALNKYVVFSGRARRKEYWYFFLFCAIFGLVFVALDAFVSAKFGIKSMFNTLFTLAILCPGLAVQVRRLHDIGKSGWWYFIYLIPIIGIILWIIWTCRASEPGPNKYGPNPI